MNALAWLIPCALFLGGLGLLAFLWSLKTNQYQDLDGAAWRALDDEPLSITKDLDPSAQENSKGTNEQWNRSPQP